MNLSDYLKKYNKVAIALSGGADSSYLLYEAVRADICVQPYFVKTVFQPQFELDDAKRHCHELGVNLRVLNLDVLCDTMISNNPSKRCYFCKKALFSCLLEQARSDGFDVLFDGTNASDDVGDRPGMQALEELKVISPLRECGLTKEEIRLRSKEAALFNWDKPAYACLATRIPYGEQITSEMLTRIESAENVLFEMGFSDFRVRVFHGAARLQFTKSQMCEALERRDEVLSRIYPFFDTVLLDMRGR